MAGDGQAAVRELPAGPADHGQRMAGRGVAALLAREAAGVQGEKQGSQVHGPGGAVGPKRAQQGRHAEGC